MAKTTRTPARPTRETPAQHDERIKTQLDKIGPKLYGVYQQLTVKQTNQARSTTVFWWYVGHDMAKVAQMYKDAGTKALASALGVARTDLNSAMRLFDVYPNLEVLNELLGRKSADGKPLAWVHIRQLISIDITDALRGGLTDRCLAQSWDHRELTARIQEALGRDQPEPTRNRGGAPINVPPTVGAALTKRKAMNAIWLVFNDRVFGKVETMRDIIAKTPADRITPGMVDEATAVIDQLKAMRDALDRELAVMAEVQAHCAQVATSHASAAPAAPPVAPVAKTGADRVKELVAAARAKQAATAAQPAAAAPQKATNGK
jgi:hypothetical protein